MDGLKRKGEGVMVMMMMILSSLFAGLIKILEFGGHTFILQHGVRETTNFWFVLICRCTYLLLCFIISFFIY